MMFAVVLVCGVLCGLVRAEGGGSLNDFRTGFEIDEYTALVATDLQNDFLSEDGVAWGLVGDSVTEHNTVENIGRLLSAANNVDMPVFISPHYYYVRCFVCVCWASLFVRVLSHSINFPRDSPPITAREAGTLEVPLNW